MVHEGKVTRGVRKPEEKATLVEEQCAFAQERFSFPLGLFFPKEGFLLYTYGEIFGHTQKHTPTKDHNKTASYGTFHSQGWLWSTKSMLILNRSTNAFIVILTLARRAKFHGRISSKQTH